ncbi:MAG: helix-turn-helix domain-containing protein [Dehalococcoidia bacterium]
MGNALPSKNSDDTAEAIQALEEAAKFVAKMVVKAIREELVNQERMAGIINCRIGAVSQCAVESNDQKERLVFSVHEAAKLMGISKGTAYSLVQTGQIPCIRWGKRMLIPRVALMKMLEEAGTVKQIRC